MSDCHVCAIHRLRCIHQGYVLVLGEAPDRLTFVLGEREVAAFEASSEG